MPQNFKRPKGKLTLVRSGPGTRQIWGKIEEANMSLKLVSPVTYMNDNQMIELKQGRIPVFIHSSLYRALKLTFLELIDGQSLDDNIKSEIGTGP